MSMSSISENSINGSSSGPGVRALLEPTIHAVLLGCAVVSILTTVGIVFVLLFESLQFFREVSLIDFLTDTKWTPQFSQNPHYGILPLFCGTLLVAGGAALIAVPLGLGTAIFLSEYASPLIRDVVKPLLEILAGIPSVVYGYLAVVFVSPVILKMFPTADIYNAANASIVVAIMILPMIVSLSEDVLRSVPRSLREGAYALGATKLDVTAKVIVPAAASGIMASILLAIARAVGETMAVTLAAGANPQLTLNPLDSIQTMTAYIVEVSQGDTDASKPGYKSLFAVGLTLFLSTLLLNVIAQGILRRVREKYE